MESQTSFFGDPKVLLSLLAILLSLFTIIWTLSNQSEQNRRWDNLNLGNVGIKIVRPVYWKEYSKEDAEHNIKWGYQPSLYAGEYYDKFRQASILYVYDKTTSGRIENVNPAFTVPELIEQLKKKNIKVEDVLVFQLFKQNFVFQNTGKTAARNVSIKIIRKEPSTGRVSTLADSQADITLLAGQDITVTTEFNMPLVNVPAQEHFEVLISFKDTNNKTHTQTILVVWSKKDNTFSFGY